MRLASRIELALGRGVTLGTLLEKVAVSHPGRPLVTEADGGLQLTTTEAAELVDSWAGAVAASSDPGDRVVLATP
ncbi:MAG: hypothetical protein KDA97_12075, partial [Acidimicrobiales bacterium]|nr:hypothetical protein [Acidimicrobiales bacterium]